MQDNNNVWESNVEILTLILLLNPKLHNCSFQMYLVEGGSIQWLSCWAWSLYIVAKSRCCRMTWKAKQV